MKIHYFHTIFFLFCKPTESTELPQCGTQLLHAINQNIYLSYCKRSDHNMRVFLTTDILHTDWSIFHFCVQALRPETRKTLKNIETAMTIKIKYIFLKKNLLSSVFFLLKIFYLLPDCEQMQVFVLMPSQTLSKLSKINILITIKIILSFQFLSMRNGTLTD